MPGATVPRGYPYPLDTDLIDVAGDIQDLANAIDNDVTTVNSTVTGKVSKGGDVMSGALTLWSNPPTANYHAVPLVYADNHYIQVNGVNAMDNPLNLGPDDPTIGAHAVPLRYANSHFVRLAETGNQQINGSFTAVDMYTTGGAPDGDNGVVNKGYADATYLMDNNDTMTGDLTMSTGGVVLNQEPSNGNNGGRLTNSGRFSASTNETTASLYMIRFGSAGDNGQKYLRCDRGGAEIGYIAIKNSTTLEFDGDITGTASDYRLKERVGLITDASARVQRLARAAFSGHYREEPDGERDMINAHDVAEVAPWAVTGERDAVREDGSIAAQKVNFAALVPTLISALGEAFDRITTLETRLAAS